MLSTKIDRRKLINTLSICLLPFAGAVEECVTHTRASLNIPCLALLEWFPCAESSRVLGDIVFEELHATYVFNFNVKTFNLTVFQPGRNTKMVVPEHHNPMFMGCLWHGGVDCYVPYWDEDVLVLIDCRVEWVGVLCESKPEKSERCW